MKNRFNYYPGQEPCHCEPIVLPIKENVSHRYHYIEQPVILPINTRVVNHYVPRPVYYPTYSRCEENVCEGTSTSYPR